MGGKSTKLKVKRANGAGRPSVPGRAILPEDAGYVHNTLKMKQQPSKTPAPKIISSCRVPRSEVQERLAVAMKTLRALPDRERRFFVVKSTSPDYVHEYIDAYNSVDEVLPKFRPTPSDVSDCLVALSWVRHMRKEQWQILWWRSFELSFGVIATYIGRSDETARKRYEEAVTDAWCAANGI
jgi:hypothetical protein